MLLYFSHWAGSVFTSSLYTTIMYRFVTTCNWKLCSWGIELSEVCPHMWVKAAWQVMITCRLRPRGWNTKQRTTYKKSCFTSTVMLIVQIWQQSSKSTFSFYLPVKWLHAQILCYICCPPPDPPAPLLPSWHCQKDCVELDWGAQLKAGLRTPDSVLTGVLLPLRRVREKMKKQTLMTPKMITPEMSALVTVFIWNTGAFRWAEVDAQNKQTNKKQSDQLKCVLHTETVTGDAPNTSWPSLSCFSCSWEKLHKCGCFHICSLSELSVLCATSLNYKYT